MLQKLLDTKRKATIGGSGIEVIADDGEDCEEQEIEDWEFAQEITSEEPITEGSSYGFANLRSDIFQRLREESSELFEYLEISTVKNAERTEMRVHAEQAKFDEDHYLSDLFEPDYALEAAMNYKGSHKVHEKRDERFQDFGKTRNRPCCLQMKKLCW